MKYIAVTLLTLISFSSYGSQLSKLSDKDIEELLIGNWFLSSVDKYYLTGNAISSYTIGGEVFFISFNDKDCNKKKYETKATWKVTNKQLIITVDESTNPYLHKPGMVVTDNVISIGKENKVLQTPGETHLQLRTKVNTCKIQNI